jgi:itaconate CoA-transferase
MGYPLKGITVIAVEQAAAAPYPSSRLADAGARVIKIERPQGDFARGYDNAVRGDSTYFVCLTAARVGRPGLHHAGRCSVAAADDRLG